MIRVPEPTTEAVEEVRSRLAELAGRTAFRERALGRANPMNLALAAPHDVYFLGIGDLADGARLEAAEIVGRRYLVMDGPAAIASAEVAGAGAAARFEANEGPFVAATADAIGRAEADPVVAGGSFELRLLRIPAIYVMALWLKDDAGHGDLLLPLDPAPPPLDALRTFSESEFLTTLRPVASERLALDDVS